MNRKSRMPHQILYPAMVISVSLLVLVLAIPTASAKPAPAPAGQTGWNLVWSDEFNGTGQPDPTNWNYVVGNGWNSGSASFDGWGNGEWEWYRPENAYQSGGNLVIRADYSSTPLFVAGGRNWYQTSARITTKGKRSIQYGAVEARIQLPDKIASWPAFWMLGDESDDTNTSNYAAPASYYDFNSTNWSSIGEVDILEHKNDDPWTFQNLFWDSRTGVFPWNCCTNVDSPSTHDVTNVTAFHTYRLEWTATTLTWLIDGNVVKTKDVSAANQEEFRKPFHIYLNMAIAGRFPGTQPNQADFPLFMNVDYVRVYSTTSPVPTPTPVHTNGSWNLSWADEFNGTGQPDPTNWNYVVGNGWNSGSASFDGWGNGEWEWYRPENAYQSGGNLVIRADYSSTPLFVVGGHNWYQTSARITTKGKRSIQYGAVEARIQLPDKIASWPAFWMLGDESDDTNTSNYAALASYYDFNSTNWSSIGEVDILEHKNDDPWTFQNLFWDSRTGVFPWNCCTNVDSPSTHDVTNVTAFHTYRLEWTATTLTWLIDGNVVKTKDVSAANQEEFRKPFHIYLNMAIAGRFPGTQPNQADFPLFMNVDYVRVYTPGTGTLVPTNTTAPTPTSTNTSPAPTNTPTNTPTQTNTPVGPTATATPSRTPTNTAIGPTATPTNTSAPPTNTPTRTNTPSGGGGCGTGTNLIANPGFETGVLNPWTLATGNGGPTQARVHTGTWASYVGTSLGRVEQVVNGLSPNTTYTLCGWFTLEVTSSTTQFGVKNYGGAQQTQTVNTSGSFVWVQLSMTFTTGTTNTSATVFFEQPTAGGNYGYSDDWWLSSGASGPTNTPVPPTNTPTWTNTPIPPTSTPTPTNTPVPPTPTKTNTPAPTATSAGGCGTGTNLIVNPGFEAGVLSPWTLATGNGGPTQARVHTGIWSGYVGTSLGRVEQVVNGLSPNTTYTLCGWFTLEVTSSTIQFGVKNYGGTQQTQTITTSGSFVWVQRSLTFTTGATNTSATVFFEQPTAGGNYGYSDDWWLVH